MTIHVSIIVPTFRRPELLNRCLAALVSQNFDPGAYEVIIVEDAAGKKSQVPNSEWAKSEEPGQKADVLPCLRYIPLPNHCGPAAARNIGWRNARGEIVAFTDDDCIPAVNWLRAGVTAFRDGVIGVSGRVIVPLSGVPTDYELNASWLGRGEFVTANCFYRRDVLAEVGGFDERFAEAWREDSDLFFSILGKVKDIDCPSQFVHTQDAVVIHPVRPAPWGISLRQQRKNMYNPLLYKKHPRLYRERLGNVRPWRYYFILGALLMCVIGFTIGQNEIAFGAGLLWMGATGLFCLQRLTGTCHSVPHIIEMAVTSMLIPPLALAWRAWGAWKFRVWFL